MSEESGVFDVHGQQHVFVPASGGNDWCLEDDCPSSVCDGPHYRVLTTLGTEVVKEGQKPIGEPDVCMHDEALRMKYPTLFRPSEFQDDDGPLTPGTFVPVNEKDDEW